ncbi:MAG: TrkH family potassium uptake protein [Candidatus Thermoplasmatota archaeon]|nr:TrkH family potassium uptake protein [Candidatus Thermoplasmatota archaeon]
MRWKVVIGNLGSILKIFGLAFFVPVIPAVWYFEAPIIFGFLPYNALVFLFMASFTITLGYPAQTFGRPEDFYNNEAIVLVSFTWIILALISSVPFLMTSTLSSPIDAFFEAMSGLTTTGATVLSFPLNEYAKSIMLWRALLQWLGGMGIIVLSVAILTKLSSGGLSLLEAEAPGPTITRLKPKIKETAKTLWYIYCLFTLMLVIILLGARVSLYDAVYHSFTTMPTGGFSPHTNSVAYFSSTIQWIFIPFMIIAGVNFSLHYQAFHGNFKKVLKNSEFRTYLGIIIGATAIITFLGAPAEIPLRDALFQTVSVVTTTGYTTAAFDAWPELFRMLLLMLMFIGGSAGSTGGGMKVLRILLIFKMVKRKLKEFINPRRVLVVRMGDSVVDEKTLETVAMFFCAYLLIFAVGAFILVALGLDMISAFAASATSLGNVGPGLGLVASDFRAIPVSGRLFMAIFMWIGRLEVFTAIVLFNPSLYKKKKLRKLLSFEFSRS